MQDLSQLPPLSLYIHIPWCVRKCPYCDFNSHQIVERNIPEEAYIKSVVTDLEQSLDLIWGRSIRSVFIGGGTPSLFTGDGIKRLLQEVRSRVKVLPGAEITLEANPGAVDFKYIEQYRKSGVNRISIGVQSFNNEHLYQLGRIHDKEDVIAAISVAKRYFDNINLDIIYGLPDQSIDNLKRDIDLALSFDTKHLSCYNLTIEPNTYFYMNRPQNLPDSDTCYLMQETIIQNLAAVGMQRYEISAYSKVGYRCSHNLNYWYFGDYLGIGAGAHSKISLHNRIVRQVRQKHPEKYMQNVNIGSHVVEEHDVGVDNLPFEFMLNALRLVDGFEAKIFTERTGLSLSAILPYLENAVAKKMIEPLHDKMIKPTQLGLDFQNDLLMLFLEDK